MPSIAWNRLTGHSLFRMIMLVLIAIPSTGFPKTILAVEGFGAQGGYPEITAAQGLAKERMLENFDTISSLQSPEFYVYAIPHLTEIEQQFLALRNSQFPGGTPMALSFFEVSYEYLGLALPSWVSDPRNQTDTGLATTIYNRPEIKANKETMLKLHVEAGNKIENLTNLISRVRLINYLEKHSEIDRVVALVGGLHTTFIDEAGQVLERREGVNAGNEDLGVTQTFRKVRLRIGNRKVTVEVFGGVHADMTAYREFEKALTIKSPVKRFLESCGDFLRFSQQRANSR